MSKNEVAVAAEEPKALAVAAEIDYAADVADRPQFTADEASLPFLRIIQKTSPQIEVGHALYLAHAMAGQLLNTVSGETFAAFGDAAAGVEVIPISFDTSYDEWVPRADGGGYVKQHSLNPSKKGAEELLSKTTKGGPRGTTDVFPSGNELVKTAQRIVMMRTAQGLKPIAIYMKSTELKKSRAWNALVADFKVEAGGRWINPAVYAGVYRLKLVREEKNGESWFNWSISAAGKATPAEYAEAKAFSALVKSGVVKVDVSKLDNEETTSGGPRPSGDSEFDNPEVPF